MYDVLYPLLAALPFALGAVLLGLITAFRAWQRARLLSGTPRRFTRAIAIHVGEPLLTLAWMASWIGADLHLRSDGGLGVLLLPMLILLYPLRFVNSPALRPAAAKLTVLGVLRIVSVCLGWLPLYRDGGGDPAWAALWYGGILGGTGLLWYCVLYGRRLLRAGEGSLAEQPAAPPATTGRASF
jgi:hypothetical protein